MNASAPDPTAEPLLFSWEPPQRERLAIAGFLALSLLAHAFCFYLIQIVYPPTVSLLPPPARVSVISSTSEEGRSLLRWIDAEDPALSFTTQEPPEARLRALPKVDYVPSYLAIEPVLKEVPAPDVDLRIPSVHPPGPVPFLHRQTRPAVGPSRTSVSFSEELVPLGSPTLPEPSFTASNNETPHPMRFRVAVSATGEIRYCFPLNSSGDSALDEQARQYLTLCRFPLLHGQLGELVWGIATVEWGTDVARAQPGPTETATP
jgi:hypothetical protein